MEKKSDDVFESGLSRRDILTTLAASGTLGVSGCLDRVPSDEPEETTEDDADSEPVYFVPELSWEFGTDGEIISSPIPVSEMMFVTSYDGRIYALAEEGEADPDVHGQEYPAFKMDNVGKNSVSAGGPSKNIEERWRFSTDGRIIQTPVVSGGDVFFGSEDNHFYSLSAETGEENWRFNAGRVVAGASPTVVEETVYVPTGNSTEMSENGVLYALEIESGEVIWSTEFKGGLGATPVVDDGRLYTGCQDGRYYALNAKTGEEIWSFEGDDVFCGSRAALMDGVVYAGSEDHSMYALNADDGSLVWEFETNDLIVSSPVATEDAVYFGSNDDNLYAVDPDTGEKLWNFEAANKVFSSPAYRDGVVYVGCVGGEAYAINGQTGEEIWRIRLSQSYAINSSPVVTEDMIYFGTEAGVVYGIDNESVDGNEYEDKDAVLTIKNSKA